MESENYYKVICAEIDLVLLIKKLTIDEEKSCYLSVKNKISKLDKPITLESYKLYIVEFLLFNSKEFLEKIPQDDEDRQTIINAVYASIIEVYPYFDLSYVCEDVNTAAFLTDFLENLRISADDPKLALSKLRRKKPTKSNISSLSDIKKLDIFLRKNLVGQEEAIKSVVDSIKLVASGLDKRASLFFIGRSGVGKTQLAKLLGEKYCGRFWKNNCAEFAQSHEYIKLIGAPPGYVGHSDKSLMYEKAQESNKWVILFDEIEKAHEKFFDFLLSLLDDGTCTDNTGRTLDFSETIFIFTSNQGVSDLKIGAGFGFDPKVRKFSEAKDDVKTSVKRKFAPEFLNRIDHYVFFNTLTKEDAMKIASMGLKKLPIKKTKALLSYIVDNAYSEEYGARNINRFIKTDVAVLLADKLLENNVSPQDSGLFLPKIVENKLELNAPTYEENKSA